MHGGCAGDVLLFRGRHGLHGDLCGFRSHGGWFHHVRPLGRTFPTAITNSLCEPFGNHTAGEEYSGCYGFATFTHDSYGYTAFRDDNGDAVEGVCPDCGGTHKHTPYEAAGTNEMGLSVSATETIGGSDAVYELDPYTDTGIEEAEIVTVLLSEAATAKAVDLLLNIYDTVWLQRRRGLFIADNTETWYIENVTGHQYLALKLSDSMAFAQPNMSIIGLIDLDDTENVIASENLVASRNRRAPMWAMKKPTRSITWLTTPTSRPTAAWSAR